MDGVRWQESDAPTADLSLAWYEAGSGPTVIFLNGGPGDDHRYLRPVAAPLVGEFRCVLYDQRGCGHSRLAPLDETTLQVERFVEDIDTLRPRLGQQRLRLVGHSWGATLALVYAVAHPDRVERLALVAMGPIDEEMDAVATANLLKPLSATERDARARLWADLRRAVDADDRAQVRALRAQEAPLGMRAWFATPEALRRFLATYLADDPPNWRVNRLASASYRRLRPGLRYERVTAPVLIVYGYQDFEPITQAYVLRARMPQAQLCFLNSCGHHPWIEQPEPFYRALRAFLR